MSETFIGALKTHCPNAKLVLDRFHIVKALNNAVDEVRKEEWREVGGDERKTLKGIRWILFRNHENRTKQDKQKSLMPYGKAIAEFTVPVFLKTSSIDSGTTRLLGLLDDS